MSELLKPEEIKKMQTAQMKLQLHPEQKSLIDCQKMDEAAKMTLPKLRSWKIERPGTEQKQILVLNEYGMVIPCFIVG